MSGNSNAQQYSRGRPQSVLKKDSDGWVEPCLIDASFVIGSSPFWQIVDVRINSHVVAGVPVNTASATGFLAGAIGPNSTSNGTASWAIGTGAFSLGDNSFCYGASSFAIGQDAFVLGSNAQALNDQAWSIGNNTVSDGLFSWVIGDGSVCHGDGCWAIGLNAVVAVTAFRAWAIGNGADSSAARSWAIGDNSTASADNAWAYGNDSLASGVTAFAFGVNSVSAASSGWSFGNSAFNFGVGSRAIGDFATVLPGADNAWVIGNNSTVGTTNSWVIGNFLTNSNGDSMLFGIEGEPILFLKAFNALIDHVAISGGIFQAETVNTTFPIDADFGIDWRTAAFNGAMISYTAVIGAPRVLTLTDSAAQLRNNYIAITPSKYDNSSWTVYITNKSPAHTITLTTFAGDVTLVGAPATMVVAPLTTVAFQFKADSSPNVTVTRLLAYLCAP